MAGRVPKSQKPQEQLRRRNPPEQWVSLPAEGCKLKPPAWPIGKPSPDEQKLWADLWALPIAAYWHETRIAPTVVARYVTLSLKKPEHATVAMLERELGLTPAAMLRMRLVVEEPDPVEEPQESPYAHLRAREADDVFARLGDPRLGVRRASVAV